MSHQLFPNPEGYKEHYRSLVTNVFFLAKSHLPEIAKTEDI
jgi:hypothetical protein